MVHKIIQRVESLGTDNHKLVTKVFQRGLQIIKTKSAYANDELYHRTWTICDHGSRRTIKQPYLNGQAVKGNRIDIQA